MESATEKTNAHDHDHEHGATTPAEPRDGGDIPTSDSKQPGPCVMAFSCATAGIIGTASALCAPGCEPVTTSLLTATIYVEPVLAAITPPPRV